MENEKRDQGAGQGEPSPSLAEQVARAAKVARDAEGGPVNAKDDGLHTLARKAGVSRPLISQIVAGQHAGIATLSRMAKATGITFHIGPETDIGAPRAPRPSEDTAKKRRR